MSDREDTDDKITVLFSEDDSSEGDGGSEEEVAAESEPEAGESNSVSPEESDDGSDLEGTEDNVVHLDFRKESTKKSPRPVSEGDSEDQKAGELQRRLESGEIDGAKYDAFCRMIDEGMVMVTLDTRVRGVDVPSKYRGLPELRLNFSHMFHIDDFDYDDDGVRASLSFQGDRYHCDVPWSSVFMLYSHETGEVVVFETPGSSH